MKARRSAGSWQLLAEGGPVAVRHAGLCVLDGSLFLFGGGVSDTARLRATRHQLLDVPLGAYAEWPYREVARDRHGAHSAIAFHTRKYLDRIADRNSLWSPR